MYPVWTVGVAVAVGVAILIAVLVAVAVAVAEAVAVAVVVVIPWPGRLPYSNPGSPIPACYLSAFRTVAAEKRTES